jgi:hypothetical protein
VKEELRTGVTKVRRTTQAKARRDARHIGQLATQAHVEAIRMFWVHSLGVISPGDIEITVSVNVRLRRGEVVANE